MKKLFILLLVAAVALNLTAFGEAPAPWDGPVRERVQLPPEIRDSLTSVRAGFPKPLDTVTVKDGVITITANGVTLQMQMPFGWLGFTQDLKQQLADYAEMFNDPRAVVEYLISKTISMLAVDTASKSQILLFMQPNTYSGLFEDLQDQESLEMALSLFPNNEELGYVRSSSVVGGMNWLRSFEPEADYDSLYYFTYFNGIEICFQLMSDGADLLAEEEEALVALIEVRTPSNSVPASLVIIGDGESIRQVSG